MRKILCIVIAFVICVISIFSVVKAEEIDDLQSKQEELQNQIQDTNGQLEGVQNELSENMQQVQKLDEQISSSNAELEEINNRILELQSTIDEVESNLAVAQENYEKQKKVVEERLVAIYEASDIEYLDVILRSKSISDFLSS